MKQLLPQQCPIAFIYLTWALYAAGLIYFILRGEYVLALTWLLALPVALWGYARSFPRISHLLGYGRVDDVESEQTGKKRVRVRIYSARGCPFCPLVEARLSALQRELEFELEHVDVTLRPDRAAAAGIKSVPVVEVEGRRLVGHATTNDLAKLLLQRPSSSAGAD